MTIGQQRVVERLDAETVAREEQRLAVAIPDREGEHAAHAFHAGLAPLLPGVHDHLRVGAGTKGVGGGDQLRHQLLVVVDFTVEYNHHRAVFIEERLLPAGKIDDGEAAMTEAHARLDMNAAFFRAAVKLALVHAFEQGTVHRTAAARIKNTDYAAHIFQYGNRMNAARSANSSLRLLALQQVLVHFHVARHHGVHTEFAFHPCTPGRAVVAAQRDIVDVARERHGHVMRRRRPHQCPGRAVDHQLTVTADSRGDNRQRTGHGFQNGVGCPFRQRRQDEDIQRPHQLGDVVARARQPSELREPGGGEHGLHIVTQRSVADDHQPRTHLQLRRALQHLHEGARDDVAELMRTLDIFVLPSLAEGISNTILEAMSCALPVVATLVGGTSELVIDGTTGALVPAAAPHDMAMALARYVDDVALRRRHGAAGRARVEREFSMDAMVARYVEVYEDLLQREEAE